MDIFTKHTATDLTESEPESERIQIQSVDLGSDSDLITSLSLLLIYFLHGLLDFFVFVSYLWTVRYATQHTPTKSVDLLYRT